MKIFVSLLLATAPKVATAACSVDDHHPVNGGYHIEGIAGHNRDENGTRVDNPNSGVDYFYPWHNASWAPGVDYPDGSSVICTGRFCSEECRTQGCPTLIESTTCAHVRFCFTKDSGSDVWLLPSEQALANCDFTEATAVCSADEGEDEDCCNYVVEEDAEIGPRFFASKEGCEQGQRAAVNVADYDVTGDQCFSSGLSSDRINKCECELADTLVEPCHSEFLQGCLQNAPDIADDDPCCASQTCVVKHQDINNPVGEAAEKSRKLLCNDDIPGNCAIGGEADCCSKTCTECGIDLDPFAKWSACTSGNSTTTSGSCGYQGYTPNTCDFTACDPDHLWHPETEAFKSWLQAVDPSYLDDSAVEVENVCGGVVCDGMGDGPCGCDPCPQCPFVPPEEPVTIYELASGAEDFSTLAAAIDAAGLADTLSGDGSLTVFAPTNKAFEKLPQELVNFLLLPKNVDQLTEILKYHVVGANVPSSSIETGPVKTLNGESVDVQTFSTGIRVDDANVVDPYDLAATNGVIHAIDSVLIPSNVELPSYTSSPTDRPVTSAPTKKAAPAPAPATPEPPVEGSSESEEPSSSTEAQWMSRAVVALIGTTLVVL